MSESKRCERCGPPLSQVSVGNRRPGAQARRRAPQLDYPHCTAHDSTNQPRREHSS
jgi:hypothetical protein